MLIARNNAPFRNAVLAPCALATLLLLLLKPALAQEPVAPPTLHERIAAAKPHPRLFMNEENIANVRARIENDPTTKALFGLLRKEADAMLEQPPMAYHKEGKRLLGVSREVLKRVSFLTFTGQITGDPKYAARAITEMMTVANFDDWNPSHFLDVAEMTAALAIGYDGLFATLSPEQETTLRIAIRDKGIAPSFHGYDTWKKRDNNWNQVCHGGLVLGALALLEHEPGLAEKTIARALDGLPYAMRTYEPDGVYVEGPSYWEYGTTYNVLLIDALESALGSCFGLDAFPGFQRSGSFPLRMTGPTGLYFNFADGGQKGGLWPAIYWFAKRSKDYGIAWFAEKDLQALLNQEGQSLSRFFPMLFLWRDGATPGIPTQPLHWRGEGKSPIAVHRSSWNDPNAVFLAIKAGIPKSNHGHMDIGSFVLDAEGSRWALDFGADNYGKLEARGLNIWNHGQHADRWRIFRYHNAGHNTLVVNNEEQNVDAAAPIANFSDNPEFPFTIVNMTPVYAGQLARAERGFSLLPDKRILIQDEITATQKTAHLRWAMNTSADITQVKPGSAVLVLGDKQLYITVMSPAEVAPLTFSTDPPNEWDAPNPNTRQIGFYVSLEPGASTTLCVLLTPGSPGETAPVPMRPLADWPAVHEKTTARENK